MNRINGSEGRVGLGCGVALHYIHTYIHYIQNWVYICINIACIDVCVRASAGLCLFREYNLKT